MKLILSSLFAMLVGLGILGWSLHHYEQTARSESRDALFEIHQKSAELEAAQLRGLLRAVNAQIIDLLAEFSKSPTPAEHRISQWQLHGIVGLSWGAHQWIAPNNSLKISSKDVNWTDLKTRGLGFHTVNAKNNQLWALSFLKMDGPTLGADVSHHPPTILIDPSTVMGRIGPADHRGSQTLLVNLNENLGPQHIMGQLLIQDRRLIEANKKGLREIRNTQQQKHLLAWDRVRWIDHADTLLLRVAHPSKTLYSMASLWNSYWIFVALMSLVWMTLAYRYHGSSSKKHLIERKKLNVPLAKLVGKLHNFQQQVLQVSSNEHNVMRPTQNIDLRSNAQNKQHKDFDYEAMAELVVSHLSFSVPNFKKDELEKTLDTLTTQQVKQSVQAKVLTHPQFSLRQPERRQLPSKIT